MVMLIQPFPLVVVRDCADKLLAVAAVSKPFAMVVLARLVKFGAVPVGVPFIPAVAALIPAAPNQTLVPSVTVRVAAAYVIVAPDPPVIAGIVPNGVVVFTPL
jgi:hypothetical protein